MTQDRISKKSSLASLVNRVRLDHCHICWIVVESANVQTIGLEFEGALYHVTSRGDRREEIYETDEDRHAFLGLLGAVCDRCNWVCHAYCLMSNHYHLLIETPDAKTGSQSSPGC